jgi:hypothetical protein
MGRWQMIFSVKRSGSVEPLFVGFGHEALRPQSGILDNDYQDFIYVIFGLPDISVSIFEQLLSSVFGKEEEQ